MNFPYSEFVVPLLILVLVAGLMWFSLDMRSILKASQRRNQLSIEGRWEDLERHYERAAKTYRPFVWFHRRYLLPGNIASQQALFFFKQGRLEEALVKVDQAIREKASKPKMFSRIYRRETLTTACASFRTRTLILAGMGRYDEARETAAQLQKLAEPDQQTNAALALLEYNCGRLDEALAHAEGVPPEDTQYDSMRGITGLCLSMKGEFEEAVHALVYEPGDISKFYTPKGLEAMNSIPDGAKLIELQRKKHAGVSRPARLLMLASVYIACEKLENAVQALDEAERAIGPEPGIQFAYCRYRACCFAALGKASEADNHIERLRTIVGQMPKRSFQWEAHFAVGRSYLSLGRYGDALAELIEAQKLILHPIEKHVTSYWIGRVHEAAGRRREAMPYYQAVAADPIPSWMRKRAVEALAQ